MDGGKNLMSQAGFTIASLHADEILDSRGRPTLQTMCRLASGAAGTMSVPSGASRGRAEALELRDGDPARYRGLGCRIAVANVNTTIYEAFKGRSFAAQDALDSALIQFDGTANKSAVGANAILSVSLAFARAAAADLGLPLYQFFARMANHTPNALSRPMINLFSGGKHAGGQTAVQDVLIVPMADTIDQILSDAYAVYAAAADLIAEKYAARALKADEGGLAPPFADDEGMLRDAVAAIERAGLTPGRDVMLAIDVAASHFYDGTAYTLSGRRLSTDAMIDQLAAWTDGYPLISIEDGLAEDDWDGWSRLRARLADRAWILGDDLLCTNPARIDRAIQQQAANALLLKVNQIGTLTEASEALERGRSAGWRVVVSARSGETEDNWLADLAVGWGADSIKIGSIMQSERLAKYNRLLIIERETNYPVCHLGTR